MAEVVINKNTIHTHYIDAVGDCQGGMVNRHIDFLRRVAEAHSLPDSHFFIQTMDHPDNDVSQEPPSASIFPVFHFCRSREAINILVEPYIFTHIDQDRPHDVWGSAADDALDGSRHAIPWEEKEDVVFASWHTVGRAHSGGVRATARRNEHGKVEDEGRKVLERMGAKLNDSSVRINLKDSKIPMSKWGRFKYLVFSDGITCSYKLYEMLYTGSLIFVERSGYECLVRTVLQPFVHYVPFWDNHPQELLKRIAWARSNDIAASQIAWRGRDFAMKFLRFSALACRWAVLLDEYSKLLQYDPETILNTTEFLH